MKLVVFGLLLSVSLLANHIKPPPPLSFLHGAGEHYVALKGFNGKWVAADDGGGKRLVADRPHVSSHETFRILCHAEDCSEVSLQVFKGQWVAAEQGGNSQVIANRLKIGAWERFKLKDHGHRQYSFQTDRRDFLKVDTGQHMKIVQGAFSVEALFTLKTLHSGFYHRPSDEL